MYQVQLISESDAQQVEYLGTKPKFWMQRGDKDYLVKLDQRGTGEDWAEKVAHELADLLGLPHVVYELAQVGDINPTPAVICRSMAENGVELILGNQLLMARDPNYPIHEGRYKVTAHTVSAVVECMEALNLPRADWIGCLPQGVSTALDVFVGYVMFDTLIANQDRHHENWGALQYPSEPGLFLAPSFDHGAGLARNLTDMERVKRLESRDPGQRVKAFAARARSGFYRTAGDTKTILAHDAFLAFARYAPDAAQAWMKCVENVSREQIAAIVEAVPESRMSPVAKVFTCELILVNQERLVEAKQV